MEKSILFNVFGSVHDILTKIVSKPMFSWLSNDNSNILLV